MAKCLGIKPRASALPRAAIFSLVSPPVPGSKRPALLAFTALEKSSNSQYKQARLSHFNNLFIQDTGSRKFPSRRKKSFKNSSRFKPNRNIYVAKTIYYINNDLGIRIVYGLVMKKYIALLVFVALSQGGCQFIGGAATGALATGAGYEIQAKRQMDRLEKICAMKKFRDGNMKRARDRSRQVQSFTRWPGAELL